MSRASLYVGDALEVLRTLPDESVQCCVTSPPYFGLRDYGVEGQLGLEPTPQLYVEDMVTAFQEVWRVLRDDGTLWLNLGDSYAGSGKGGNPEGSQWAGFVGNKQRERSAQASKPIVPCGLKSKDLVGIPWRVAFALQADGWWLRSDIIWSKPNPMPESVTDRPTKAHEYVFLFSKSQRYFYDADAVAEPNSINPKWNYGSEGHRKILTQDARKTDGDARRPKSCQGWDGLAPAGPMGTGRNARTVWEITTKPYPNAHFATFPPELAERCIRAGTSQKGCCLKCGAPWERISEVSRTFESGSGRSGRDPVGKNGPSLQGGGETRDIRRGPVVSHQTTGWQPTCDHDTGPVPCTVLDPFGGSGTTASVATGLGRNAIHIDLNPEYLDLARDRIGPMLVDVKEVAA